METLHPSLFERSHYGTDYTGNVTFSYAESLPVTLSRHDFFAGMALNALIVSGRPFMLAVEQAWKVADEMVKHNCG